MRGECNRQGRVQSAAAICRVHGGTDSAAASDDEPNGRLSPPLAAASLSASAAPRRYTHEYGEKKEKFNQSLFLVFFQCIGNPVFAAARTNSSQHITRRAQWHADLRAV